MIAESDKYERPLYMHDMSFAKLIDQVVVPYETGKSFFIDGVPLEKSNARRLKIVQQRGNFSVEFERLHNDLKLPRSSGLRIDAADYPVRLDALFRQAGDDVTSQVISAYQATIKDRLKEYLPKRDELISAALQVFGQAMKSLTS